MKRILSPGIVLLLLSTLNPFDQKAVAQCNNTTVLSIGSTYRNSSFTGNGNFNAIIFGTDTITGGDIEGRAAMGNNFIVTTGSGVAYAGHPGIPNGTDDNLIVNNNFNNTGGNWQVNGNFIYNTYSGSLPSHASGAGSNIGGQTNYIHFSDLLTYYKGLSTNLAARTVNGTATTSGSGSNYRQVTLTGTNSTLNVFSVDIPAGTSGLGIDIDVPANSDVVINVTSASVNVNGGSMNLHNTTQSRILWNFVNATNFTTASYAWLGSILAPYMRILGNGGNINGQVVIGGNAIHTSGFEFHNYCYEGTITYTPAQPPVPDNKYNVAIPYSATVRQLQLFAGSSVNTSNGSRQTVLSGTDADGTIVSYNIKTLPDATIGSLYYNNGSTTTKITQLSQLPNSGVLTLAQAANLYFKPVGTPPADTVYAVFTYSVTDNSGTESLATASYTIPVVPSGTPLAIKLESFTATVQQDDVVLQWTTASETDNDYFDVERSNDGRSFTAIAQVKGHGTTNAEQSYRYNDALNASATYYRLRQVDFDGTSTYSNTVAVKGENVPAANTSVYPNPFNGSLTISTQLKAGATVDVRIMDITGKLLIQQSQNADKGIQTIHINETGNLPSGMYLLQVICAGEQQNFRIIKQ